MTRFLTMEQRIAHKELSRKWRMTRTVEQRLAERVRESNRPLRKRTYRHRTYTAEQIARRTESHRKWAAANPERARESNRLYKASAKYKEKRRLRKRYPVDQVRVRAQHRKWEAANRERVREYSRSYRRSAKYKERRRNPRNPRVMLRRKLANRVYRARNLDACRERDRINTVERRLKKAIGGAVPPKLLEAQILVLSMKRYLNGRSR